MKNYSIVRIGHEYVVQADAQSVLKVASRRRAARLVCRAAELLDAEPQILRKAGQCYQSSVILPKFLDDPGRFP